MTHDWHDPTRRQAIDARIAELVGWEIREQGQIRYYDPTRGAFTPYYRDPTDLGEVWSPTEALHHALEAAGLIADRRRLPFRLDRTTEGYWVATFLARSADELRGMDVSPLRAIVEALLKVARMPDLERLFGRPRGHA